ncbi:metallophosphoesterase family protein [Rhizobium mesosinicum]|uniref:Metallophosphoesterase n=1 Tax=Rhizobium mesosinicum TaxID=335017 RepID=A0ABS7GUU7_9HYPH|nr:metallophosphoesterase [Rhizobium mesosinicum]MBW9053723.1 metallophosphoesterase [Rhizobium mesosinicum]
MAGTSPIKALLPKSAGHQFVLYGDSCSGVAGALHERTFASVNAVLHRLRPQPQFILFPGDEIIGLTADEASLRAQWRHWFDVEMAWLDRVNIPMWHTTGNHTTYDEMSEAVFRDTLGLPANGPAGQEGLAYWVRRGDLLMVFVHTLWSGLGGEGHVETEWLEATLRDHADARYKLVLGHHPVFPVNGYAGAYQREIGHEYAGRFWDTLVKADVFAYCCSHILAFDVQVRRGVLQICTAGAGTAHRMPEGVEYLHCIQAALDEEGLRYQVLDTEGIARESLQWPPVLARGDRWLSLPHGVSDALWTGPMGADRIIELRLSGRMASDAQTPSQTIFSAFGDEGLAPLWLGLRGRQQQLTLILGRDPGRSPYYFFGPALPPGEDFDLHILLHGGMGPGGVLWRRDGSKAWSSFEAIASTGLERLVWPCCWSVGHGQKGKCDRRFTGESLRLSIAG